MQDVGHSMITLLLPDANLVVDELNSLVVVQGTLSSFTEPRVLVFHSKKM